jgi:hypothetical protein
MLEKVKLPVKRILTGVHLTSGPKNLSSVYKYLTLSLASLAASVI